MSADPLELATRRRLYLHLVDHPGKYLRELQRDLAMAMGALEHHLRELERAGLVAVDHGAHKRFDPVELGREEKRTLGFLRETLPRRTLLLLLARGRQQKADLLAALGVAPSTLNYHLKRLADAGLIRGEREGRDAVYLLARPDEVARLAVAYRSSLLDRMVDGLLEGLDGLR